MRISLINVNVIREDAIGQSILHQLSYFLERGDSVRVYVEHVGLHMNDRFLPFVVTIESGDLKDEEHFRLSDLYIFHYPGYYELLETVSTIDRGVVALNFHNVTPTELWDHSFVTPTLERSHAELPRIAHLVDFVLCDSPYNAETIVDATGVDDTKVRILPLAVGINPNGDREDVPQAIGSRIDDKKVMLFVGRIASNKNVGFLVDVLARVGEKLPNTVLLIVGDDASNPAVRDETTLIHNKARSLGLPNRVVFAGRVPQVEPFYAAAHVYVTASLHEGFDLPVLEAMSAGVPVVASDIEAHRWSSGGACCLANTEDPVSFANTVVNVLKNDELRNRMIARGKVTSQRYSVTTYNRNLQRFIVEATRWLPTTYFPDELDEIRSTVPELDPTDVSPSRDDKVSRSSFDYLRDMASLYDRQYRIRNHLPVIGPPLSWARQFIIRQFHEEVIKLGFGRQEVFNVELIRIISDLATRIDELERRVSKGESREFRPTGKVDK